MKDFSKYNLDVLDVLIVNYRRSGKDRTEEFIALLHEREKKIKIKDFLDTNCSLDLLKHAARENRFVSYGDLAAASGLQWSHTIRARMSGAKGHLDRLLDICHSQGLPLLTALCVNKKNLETGELDAFSLSGFADGARRLGHTILDEKTFYKECQRESFEWGRSQP